MPFIGKNQSAETEQLIFIIFRATREFPGPKSNDNHLAVVSRGQPSIRSIGPLCSAGMQSRKKKNIDYKYE